MKKLGLKPLITGDVAIFCQHFYPEMNSTGLHMTELATGLARRNYSVRVYCAQSVHHTKEQSTLELSQTVNKQIKITRVPSLGSRQGGVIVRGLFSISFLAFTAWSALRDHARISVAVVTTNPPFIGLAAFVLKKLTGTGYLTIVYDVYPDIAVQLGILKTHSILARLWDKITHLILKNSASVVVIGRDMEQVVEKKVEIKNKIVLIPNWSDENRIRPVQRNMNNFAKRHNIENKFVVQYSGRMGRTHNIEPLLDAAVILHNEAVIFQFLGDGFKKSMLKKIASDRDLDNVQFLPFQPIVDLAEVLSTSSLSVVCLGSQFTGLSVPSKTYGILASGRPILALLNQDSEIGQIIREADCGIVLADPSGSEIAHVIRKLMSHPKRLEQMGANGREYFLKNCTLSIAVERYDQLLQNYFVSGLI